MKRKVFGIPYPLELETLLNAMELAYGRIDWLAPQDIKFERQYKAFRTRILKMFSIGRSINADLHFEIEMIEASYSGLQYEMEKALKDKDKRIAELDKENEQLVVLTEEIVKRKDKIIVELENKIHHPSNYFLERDQYGRLIDAKDR